MSRKIHADEQGISPVLGAALAIGVIVTISSTVLAVWVPSELNRREYEHLQGVERSLREFKATIEDLWTGENRSVDLKMGPEPLPLVPNPKRGGTLSVTPAELEIRGESGKLFRVPSEDKISAFEFEILPGELETYDWYIIAMTGEDNERIESVFIYVNRDASGLDDYHYTPASDDDREETFPKVHGGMDNKLYEDWNYITVKVASGKEGAWVEIYVVKFPACTPWEDVHLENKSVLGSLRYDWEDQSWVYESGMIIWVQDNTSSMKSPPSVVTVMQKNENNFEVHFNIIGVRGVEGSVSGTGTSTIAASELKEREYPPEENREYVTIRINSSYRGVWAEYLGNVCEELEEMGITADLDEDTLTLIIQGGGKNIQFYRKVTYIEVNLE